MYPVGRRLFTILSAVSLVLCLALVGLWVRSYWRLDSVVSPAWKSRTYEASSGMGQSKYLSFDGPAL